MSIKSLKFDFPLFVWTFSFQFTHFKSESELKLFLHLKLSLLSNPFSDHIFRRWGVYHKRWTCLSYGSSQGVAPWDSTGQLPSCPRMRPPTPYHTCSPKKTITSERGGIIIDCRHRWKNPMHFEAHANFIKREHS